MSEYYTGKRKKNIFNPDSVAPFKISRSKIDLYLRCPRCFYIDRRLGISPPPGYPFTLNSAVDALLKREFDIYREKQTQHPVMKAYGIEAVPFKHERLSLWRNTLKGGIEYLHKPTNFIVTGAVDDIWTDTKGQIYIVDYKATAKTAEVTIDAEWQESYKKQMEVYQWLFRRNRFNVSPIGYFVYCNGLTDKENFNARLEFDIKIISYNGNDNWIESIIVDMHKCLVNSKIPEYSPQCDYCTYIKAIENSIS
jgi:hypothetical protein